MLYSQYDFGSYQALNSAQGSPNTNFRGVLQIVRAYSRPESQEVEGEASLGSGMYRGPSVQTGVNVVWGEEGRFTMNKFPTDLFDMLADRVTVADGAHAGVFDHTWSPIAFNRDMPWWTKAMIYGQGATKGVGIGATQLHDAKITAAAITVNVNDAMRFTKSGVALQEGPLALDATFDAETVNIQPMPSSSTHVFTYPTEMAAFSPDLCLNSFNIGWTAQAQLGEPCIDSDGEPSDILIITAGLSMDFKFQYNDASQQLYEYINYGQVDPVAGTRALKNGFERGPFGFNIKSKELIGTAPKNIPYEFSGNVPLQWKSAERNSESGIMSVGVKAMTYEENPTWVFRIKNGHSDAEMNWPLAA